MFSSPLQRALTRGMKPDGDLADELLGLDEYTVRSRKDAKKICDALRYVRDTPAESRRVTSPLHALTALFQEVGGPDEPAYEVLHEEGLPLLMEIFDQRLDAAGQDEDDLLFILKIFAMYGTLDGTETIVRAARRPLSPDAYLWHVILASFREGHPHRQLLLDSLRDPLPEGFLAVALLDAANAAALEGELDDHPFDSSAGHRQLGEWLRDRQPDHFTYALSATAALPFISQPPRNELLELALPHPDPGVRMEAAWAGAKLGQESGFQQLAQLCLDIDQSDVAQRYLTELDREDLIPDQAQDASFQALAEFSRWLSHPNELGQAPDELEIIDDRELPWPPDQEPRRCWLIRYRLVDRTGLQSDDVDCGMVGSVTWCFFAYQMHRRPPEDVYAIHCCWEMEHAGLIEEMEVTDPEEYARLLGQWQSSPVEEPKVTRVSEISPKLQIPSRLVALATARRDGQPGWLVLDGPRSAWYPASEQPEDEQGFAVLKLHVGRSLLGFDQSADRAAYLKQRTAERTPAEVVAAYEQLLDQIATADAPRQVELLGSRGPLAQNFDRYVESAVVASGREEADVVIETFERLLELANHCEPAQASEIYDVFGVLGEAFPRYAELLAERGRSSEVAALIQRFAPFWDHNMGYGRLGCIAMEIDDLEKAEMYLTQLHEGLDEYYRSEAMSLLAEIWHRRGESDRARKLLLHCLKQLMNQIEQSRYASDRQMYAEKFGVHRDTFVRLFDDGEAMLDQEGIPVEPM